MLDVLAVQLVYHEAIAAVAAWLLIGQSLEALQVLGGAIVVAGIVVAQSVRLSAEGV